jgi:hypothetical protein
LKKTAIAVAVSVFCFVSLLPVVRSVNHSADKLATTQPTLVADGWPLPIPHTANSTLAADGWPLPIPHTTNSTLVADGWPLPIPHRVDLEIAIV